MKTFIHLLVLNQNVVVQLITDLGYFKEITEMAKTINMLSTIQEDLIKLIDQLSDPKIKKSLIEKCIQINQQIPVQSEAKITSNEVFNMAEIYRRIHKPKEIPIIIHDLNREVKLLKLEIFELKQQNQDILGRLQQLENLQQIVASSSQILTPELYLNI